MKEQEPSYENRNSDLMNAEIYNALLSAGVATNEAEKAAKASAQSSMQYIQLNQKVDSSVERLEQKIDSSAAGLNQKVDSSAERLDQKIDGSVERLEQKIDNKSNTTHALLIGLVVVVVAQIIAQYLF